MFLVDILASLLGGIANLLGSALSTLLSWIGQGLGSLLGFLLGGLISGIGTGIESLLGSLGSGLVALIRALAVPALLAVGIYYLIRMIRRTFF